MKTVVTSLFVLLCSLSSFPLLAAEIIWVVQEDGPAGVEFIEMLETEGHTVTVMVLMGAPPDQSEQDTLNAADLVVISRKVNSGDPAYNTFVWNDTITAPLISVTPYILRTVADEERWQWLDGDAVIDSTPSPVAATDPEHKIFEGIPLTDGVSSDWHFAIDRNTSVSTSGLTNGGRVIARKTAGPADAIIAAEWDAGQVAAGPRMMFLMGAREPAENNGVGADYGRFNLTEVGQIAYLNAISHYAGPWGPKQLFAPATKDLGEVDSAPGEQEIRILVKNLGLDEPVAISGITFEGAGAEYYAVKEFPSSLAPAEVAEIVIALDTQGNTGAFDADLVIANDSTMESLQQRRVSLRARAFNFGGPAAHYRLDEIEGEMISDVTGFDRHATVRGAVDLTAASLIGDDGTGAGVMDGYIEGDLSTAGPFADFAISLWMSADPDVEGLRTIFARDGGDPVFALFLNGQELEWYANAQPAFATMNQPITFDTTHHVVAVYEQSNDESLRLYVDGVEVANATGLPNFTDDLSNPLLFGSFRGGFGLFGELDDLQVYGRSITADDVTHLYNNPGEVLTSLPPVDPPVVEDGIPVVWVDGPESEAGREFKDLLDANGFNVTEMFVSNPTPEEQAQLNAAGVVIVSRKVDSGVLNNQTWDDTITAPLILMSAYLSRANRWAWLGGDGLIDITASQITVEAPGHPLFSGLDVMDGVTAGWHEAIDRGTSVPTEPIANGGMVLASGDGSMIAAEWPPGTVAVGPRMLFAAGSREADGANIDTAGQYDLTAEGEIAFLNAVRYMVSRNFDGLLGYWRFDEGEGNATVDSSGNENDGVIVGPESAWVEDASRGTVYQAGGGSYVDLGAVMPVLATEDDFTWSFWVNADETANNNIVFGNRYMPDGMDFTPREFIKFTPTTFEWHFDGAGQNLPADNANLPVGEWSHNLVVKSGTTLTYYRDGQVIATGEITGAPVNAQPLYLGGQPGADGATVENFSGLFDEVAIFDRALSPTEVALVYAVGSAGLPLTPGGGGPIHPPVTEVGDPPVIAITENGISLQFGEGTTADVQYSTDLISWTTIATGVTAYEDTDPDRLANPVGFYRGAAE